MLSVNVTGKGTPLVFVHAFPFNKKMWASSHEALSGDFQVISCDMPGFGGSPLPSATTAMDAMAQALLQTLDGVIGSKKAVFVGESMGGYVLFQVFQKAPERVRGLILAATRASADTNAVRDRRAKTCEAVQTEGVSVLAEKMVPTLFGKNTLASRSPVIEEAKQWVREASADGVCAALRGMAARPDSTPLLPRISVPVLVLAGEEDGLIPLEESRKMAETLPQGRLETAAGCGHLINPENPALFHGAIAGFAGEL